MFFGGWDWERVEQPLLVFRTTFFKQHRCYHARAQWFIIFAFMLVLTPDISCNKTTMNEVVWLVFEMKTAVT